MKVIFCFLHVLLIPSFFNPAVAQTSQKPYSDEKSTILLLKKAEQDTIKHENNKALTEFVITAQRQSTLRFSTAEAIDVLSATDINNFQARTTPEALTNSNGVFVQKTNHGGGSPFIRGLTGNQTLLLVDGIRLSNATFRYGPNQYLNTIDPLSIERIEVLRGSGSVAYGSDALGGTIQVFTKNPLFSDKNAWHARVFGRMVTQQMEQTGRSELGFSNKKMAVSGGLSYRNFGDLVGGDTTGKQSPSGYQELDFDIKSRFLLTNRLILTVAHQNVKQSQVPVFHKVRLENFDVNAFEPQRRQLSYARVDIENDHRFIKKIYAIASLQNTEEGRNSRKKGSSVLRIENDKVRSVGFSVNVFSEISNAYSANSGIEMYDDLVKSTRSDMDSKTNISTAKRGLYPNDSKMTNYSVFSMHHLKMAAWQFTLGARLNGFNIQVQDEILGKSTLKPLAFVWNGAILRGITPHLNVFFSLNSSFRAPNIDDLGTLGIVDFRFETPNFNLDPEKSYNAQGGFKYKNERLSGETYVFRNALRHLIARVRVDTQKVQGYPLYQKENVEKGYIQGIETMWKYAFTEGMSVESSVAYTYGENVTKTEPLRRIPPLNARWAVNFNKKNWFSSLEILGATQQNRLSQGDKDDNRIPTGGTPGWLIANLHGCYSFKNGGIHLSFQNLLNADYRTHGSGINGIGRSASLSINYAF